MIERSVEDAFAAIAAGFLPVRDLEQVALADAHGRILARPLVSTIDLPPHDVAAMDGYAVRSGELVPGENEFPVVGRVLAGSALPVRLAPGQSVRIMTGAPMPEGSDAVVVLELARALDGTRVALPGPVAPGANRRARGEHVRAGDAVLPARRRVRAADIALAAAVGADRLDCYRRLRVGVASTGDELRDPPAELAKGCVYDSNRPMLLADLDRAVFEIFDLGICPDDAAALERLVDHAVELRLDALLLSGGAAQGDADVVRRLPGISFAAVALRPGRGIAHGTPERAGHGLCLLGLPGNAVAAYVMFHLIARPVLLRLGGSDAGPPDPVRLPILRDLTAKAGRVELRRARLRAGAGGGQALETLAEQGSAMIRSVSEAQALVAVGPEASYRAGDLLPAYLLDSFA